MATLLDLMRTVQQAPARLRRSALSPVPIPWLADGVRDPRNHGRVLGRFDRARAAEVQKNSRTKFNRDDDGTTDLAPGFESLPYFDDYDQVAIQVSGGKDSVACVVMVMQALADRPDLRKRVQIWHQDVDAGGDPFMDWPVTASYVQALGDFYGVRVLFSQRAGGFLGEIRRGPGEARGAKQVIDPETGRAVQAGKVPTRVSEVGRLRFPAPSPDDMNARWCTNELKTDVAKGVLAHYDLCFPPGKGEAAGTKTVLWITGERASESKKRVKYHRGQEGESTRARIVHQWRPVFDHVEADIWAELEHAFPGKRYGIQPHPAYELGWGRCSCAGCIFGGPAEFSRLRQVLPDQYARIVAEEARAHARAWRGAAVVEPKILALEARRGAIMEELPELRSAIRAHDKEITRLREAIKGADKGGHWASAAREREKLADRIAAHQEDEDRLESLLEERDANDKETRVLRGSISATIKAEGTIPSLIVEAQARARARGEVLKGAQIAPAILAFWGPYARAEVPWTRDHVLRGLGAPVFDMAWTMPKGAMSGGDCGPP